VSSVSADEPFCAAEIVERAMAAREIRVVPDGLACRNIDPSVGELYNVYV